MNNRKLKFRVWDKKYNKFVVSTDFNDGAGITLDGFLSWASESQFGNVQDPNRFIITQFTGLKDKNHREIYDGDILEVKDYDGWFDKVGLYFNKVVNFESKVFEEYESAGYISIQKDREIIGNIFENPELLNKNE